MKKKRKRRRERAEAKTAYEENCEMERMRDAEMRKGRREGNEGESKGEEGR